jgi:hypothetical protein
MKLRISSIAEKDIEKIGYYIAKDIAFLMQQDRFNYIKSI